MLQFPIANKPFSIAGVQGGDLVFQWQAPLSASAQVIVNNSSIVLTIGVEDLTAGAAQFIIEYY
jgi:hypothetical protein